MPRETPTAAPRLVVPEHESKFLLPASRVVAARALLRGTCRPQEPFAASRVSTLYFDSRRLDLVGEKWASDFAKTKVRLRWYDGRGPVFLEVKRRAGTRREKLRRQQPYAAAALESAAAAEVRRWNFSEMLGRLDPEALPGLEPTVRLSYLRERFVLPGSTARLNLDSEISIVELAPWCPAARDWRPRNAPLEVAVVELKGEQRELPPVLRALADLGARRGALSKYAACLAADWE